MGSMWNGAGTFEEKNVSKWAKETLEASLQIEAVSFFLFFFLNFFTLMKFVTFLQPFRDMAYAKNDMSR